MNEMVPRPTAESSLETVQPGVAQMSAEKVFLRRSQELSTERSYATAFTLGAAAADLTAFAFGLPQRAFDWSVNFLFDIANTPGCVSGIDFRGKTVGAVQECMTRINGLSWDVIGPLKSPLIWASAQQTFKEYAGMVVTAAIAGGAVYLTYRAARAWLRDIPDIINRPLDEDVVAARTPNE